MNKNKKRKHKKTILASFSLIALSTMPNMMNVSAYGHKPITQLPQVTIGGERVLTNYEIIPRVTKDTKVMHNLGKNADVGSRLNIMMKDIEKGISYVKYSNVAFYNGKQIDIKKTIMDYKEFRPLAGYENLSIVSFGKANIDVAMTTTFDEVTYKDEYFISGTNEKIELPMVYTFGDVDFKQYVKLKKRDISGRVIVNDTSKIQYEETSDGYIYFSNDIFQAVEAEDKNNWFSAEMKQSTIVYTYGSLKEDGVAYQTPEQLAKIPFDERCAYHSLEYAIPKKTDILPLSKSVKDSDESGLENTLRDLNESYSYNFKHTVLGESNTNNYFKSYTISDQLVDALELKEITVKEEQSGNDVTSKFAIKVTGNDFTATLKNPGDASFYGKSYIWSVHSKINPSADLSRWMNKTKTSLVFPNKAVLKIDNIVQESNEVKTTVPIKQLTIKKMVDKKIAEVGQEINYDIEVTNLESITQSAEVLDDIKDVLNNSEYIKGSLIVDGKAVTEEKDKDAFSLTDGLLNGTVTVSANKSVKISFKVKATKATEEKDFMTNVATLKTPKGETPSNKVETEVPTLLEIKKDVNKNVAKIGEDFDYTLTVTNNSNVDQKGNVTDNLKEAIEFSEYQIESIKIDDVAMSDKKDEDAAEIYDNILAARVNVKAKTSQKITFKMRAIKSTTEDKKIVNVAELEQNNQKKKSNEVTTKVPNLEDKVEVSITPLPKTSGTEAELILSVVWYLVVTTVSLIGFALLILKKKKMGDLAGDQN